MRIENSLRPSMIVLTATVAIVCGSWHDLATGSAASAAVNTLGTSSSVPASVQSPLQVTQAATQKNESEILQSNAEVFHGSRSARRLQVLAPAQPPMIEVGRIERSRIEPRPEAEVLNPVRLDSPMPILNLPPVPSDSVAPPPTPRIGMFARVKPALVADTHMKHPAITGAFGEEPNAMSMKTNHATEAVAVSSFGAGAVADGRGTARRGAISGTSFGTNVVYDAPRRDSLRVAEAAVFVNSAFGGEQVAIERSEPRDTPPVVESERQARYTAEAEQARIQGEVTLKVRFLASGQLEVIGVVSGLGHGLDEEARHVAESIRFKPALRNGQPVDRTTLIHVTFQLV